ncbi:MAG: signal peptidase I, partial [Pyrinomonadaceae bacterium]|nr:signal peptidase I [Phycisphaerales bacterium]
MMSILAQNSQVEDAAGIAAMLIYLAIIVLVIVGFWKVFEKAGYPGWAAIVPIYNLYIMCKIAGRPGWWVILMFIPIVSIIIYLLLSIDIAKSFGKGA